MRKVMLAAAMAVMMTGTALARPAFHVGQASGGRVDAYSVSGDRIEGIIAFEGFAGGVRVATGDVNGDGTADVVAGAGPGGGPRVRAIDGRTGQTITDFFAYEAGFGGGVFVAAGDLDGDGAAEIVAGAGAGGGPNVRVFSGTDGSARASFFAFDPGFTGGVSVATGLGDIIVAAGAGGGPHIRVFDGQTLALKQDFFAFDPSFTGGVSIATGLYQGIDALFVGAGAGAVPLINIFDLAGGNLLTSFLAFDVGFRGGVNVGFTRVDGRDTLLAGMASRGGTVTLFDTGRRAPVATDSFAAFGPDYDGGVFVSGFAAAVPEPATWAQLILGFALAGAARRRVATRGALV